MSNANNPFIEFYGKFGISPVHQDVSNLNLHLYRREKLYRALGMPTVLFKGKRILEVGPGGGFNSLAFFAWGADMDFVEPNLTAQNEIPELLSKHGIEQSRWSIYKDRIESVTLGNTYDIIIAEGFLPGIYNQKEIIEKLSYILNPGGVVTVTCIDEISFFFELLRRVISNLLIKNIDDFDQKVKILSAAFKTHLDSLKYSSRPVEDYVTDQFLNPAFNANLFSISDCIEYFGDEFEVLGGSPNFFTDYSWSKDTENNTKEEILEQYHTKKHLFLITELEETKRKKELNDKLYKAIASIRVELSKLEANDFTSLERIIEILSDIYSQTIDMDVRIQKAINEAIELIKDENISIDKVAKCHHFKTAFGKGQQYLSMVKRFSDK